MRYSRLKSSFHDLDERRRVVAHLTALREQLDREVPAKDAENELLLATWNIRDLGKAGGGYGYGPRLTESLFYIAEILSRFDFVAIQEVNELDEFERILEILGHNYDFIASDVTAPPSGNGERLTYVYDRRKVWFQNIVGELVLPTSMLISSNVVEKADDDDVPDPQPKAEQGRQFARTPYLASFQAGWLKFDICTAHIYYGAESGEELQRRIAEIGTLARFFGKRADDALADGRALILLGDFNVVNPEHQTMQALLAEGFEVPEVLRNRTNIDQTKFYDQIAFKTKPDVLDYLGSGDRKRAGTIDIFERLFTPAAVDEYESDAMPFKKASEEAAAEKARKEHKTAPKPQTMEDYFLDWRTWQISDHRPMWVQLEANDSATYLKTQVFE